MFSWPDVAATLGIVALAILGGYLKVLPDKLVVALVMAAVGYFGARTALAKRAAKDEAKRASDGGVVEGRGDVQESGRINIKPQQSGRIVDVSADGSVHIGPAPGTEHLPDPGDVTPTDGLPPVTDEEPKE